MNPRETVSADRGSFGNTYPRVAENMPPTHPCYEKMKAALAVVDRISREVCVAVSLPRSMSLVRAQFVIR
jgi:hypothetical protein